MLQAITYYFFLIGLCLSHPQFFAELFLILPTHAILEFRYHVVRGFQLHDV